MKYFNVKMWCLDW